MLLNYLYANFLEEAAFAEACGVAADTLKGLIEKRAIPKPAYVYEAGGRSLSFVSDHRDQDILRFHLRGQIPWVGAARRLGLDAEAKARAHFERRYDAARTAFLSSDLGARLARAAPAVPRAFDAAKADATWECFLDGVYGVCTRDGLPETVFLKQAGVLFIEAMAADPSPDLDLLKEAVDALDAVASPFAPHEVERSSRQRCVINIRAGPLRAPAKR